MPSTVHHPVLSQEYGAEITTEVTPDGTLTGYAVRALDSLPVSPALLPPKLRATLRDDALSRAVPAPLLDAAHAYIRAADEAASTRPTTQRRIAPDNRINQGRAREEFMRDVVRPIITHCEANSLHPVETLVSIFDITPVSAGTWLREARRVPA